MSSTRYLIILIMFSFVSYESSAQMSKSRVLVQNFSSLKKGGDVIWQEEISSAFALALKANTSLQVDRRSVKLANYSVDTVGYDFIIECEYLLNEKEFLLKGSVISIKSSTNVRQDKRYLLAVSGTRAEMLSVIQNLANNAITSIGEVQKELFYHANSQAKKVGVVGAALPQEFQSDFNNRYFREVMYSLYLNLKGNEKVQFVKYEVLKDYQLKAFEPRTLLSELKLDGLIVLDMEIGRSLTIHSTLWAMDFAEAKVDTLSYYPVEYTDDIEVQQYFGKYLINNTQQLIDESQRWVLKREYENKSMNYYSRTSKQSLQDGDFSYAFLIGQAAVAKYPDEPESYLLLGNAHFSNDEFQEARKAFEQALDKDEDNYEAIQMLAKIGYNLGEFSEAIHYYDRAITLNSSDAENYMELGKIYYYQENYIGAIHFFEQPEFISSESKMLLGLAYAGMQRYDDAIALYESLRKEPGYNLGIREALINTYLKKAEVDYLSKNYEAMAVYLKPAVEELKDDRLFNYLIAGYNRMEQFEQADQYMQLGFEEGVLKSDIYVNQADDLRRIQNSDGSYSKVHLQQAINYLLKYKLTDNSEYINRRIGGTHFRMQQYDSAIYYYEIALQMETNPSNYLNLAEVLTMNGEYEKSNSYCEKVLALRNEKSDDILNGHAVVTYYLMVSNDMLSGVKKSLYLPVINNFIEQNSYRLQWSFKTFEDWLDAQKGVNHPTKYSLKTLSDKIQKRSY